LKTSSSWNDIVGGNNGLSGGDPTLTSTGTNFDGSADQVILPEVSSLDLGNEITINAWIKTSDGGDGTYGSGIVKRGKNSNTPETQQYALYVQGGYIKFALGDGNFNSNVLTGPRIDNNVEHMITGVLKNDNTMELWVDGSISKYSIKTVTYSEGITASIIGSFKLDNNFYRGSIKDVKIWNYALSTNDILNEYYHGGNVPTLISHWPLKTSSGYNDIVSDYDGSAVNSPTLTSSGANFDGNYVNIPKVSDLNLGNEITINAWIKTSDSGDGTYGSGIVKRGRNSNTPGHQQYALYVQGGYIKFAVGDGTYPGTSSSNVLSGPKVDNNVEHMVTGVLRSSNQMELWVDKIRYTLGTKTVDYGSNSITASTVGSFKLKDKLGYVNNYYIGKIRDVKIWDYALSTSEIGSEYNNNR